MRLSAVFALIVLWASTLSANAFDTRATAALVVDYDTGTILLEKNADIALPPASMSKLMTLNMLFEALQEGRLRLDSKFRVSTKAWQMGGSKMFVKEGESIDVEDLIRGIIIQSGNDACVVVAEGLAGSEAEFANRMTKRARKLGMENSIFANSTGWPHPDHRMSAKDLVTLATHLIREFPRRVVYVIMGLGSTSERAQEGERVVSWAFREFTQETLFAKDEIISVADVWLGAADNVGLVPSSELSILVPYSARDEVKATVVYDGPIEAPIAAGDQIAQLNITIPGLSDQSYPLVAADTVDRGGFLKRMAASAQLLSQKVMETAASNAQ